MKCFNCGKSPSEHGVTLFRQNEKGVTGIWACEACNRLPVDPALAQDVAELQRGISPKNAHITGGEQ